MRHPLGKQGATQQAAYSFGARAIHDVAGPPAHVLDRWACRGRRHKANSRKHNFARSSEEHRSIYGSKSGRHRGNKLRKRTVDSGAKNTEGELRDYGRAWVLFRRKADTHCPGCSFGRFIVSLLERLQELLLLLGILCVASKLLLCDSRSFQRRPLKNVQHERSECPSNSACHEPFQC